MGAVTEFFMGLASAAVGCCILRMLTPKGPLEEVMRVLLAAFFLLSIIKPVFSLQKVDIAGVYGYSGESLEAPELGDTVNSAINESVAGSLTSVISSRLEGMGIFNAKVFINVNTNEGGSIDITDVAVTLPKKEKDSAKKVEQYITGELMLPARTVIAGEDENE